MDFNTTKLNISMVAIVDQKFKFVLKKEKELELLKGIYSTLALVAVMAVRVYGCKNCIYAQYIAELLYNWVILKL